MDKENIYLLYAEVFSDAVRRNDPNADGLREAIMEALKVIYEVGYMEGRDESEDGLS